MQVKTNWCVPVPKKLDDLLTAAVENGLNVSKAEFIRDSVKEKLQHLGFDLTAGVSCVVAVAPAVKANPINATNVAVDVGVDCQNV